MLQVLTFAPLPSLHLLKTHRGVDAWMACQRWQELPPHHHWSLGLHIKVNWSWLLNWNKHLFSKQKWTMVSNIPSKVCACACTQSCIGGSCCRCLFRSRFQMKRGGDRQGSHEKGVKSAGNVDGAYSIYRRRYLFHSQFMDSVYQHEFHTGFQSMTYTLKSQFFSERLLLTFAKGLLVTFRTFLSVWSNLTVSIY